MYVSRVLYLILESSDNAQKKQFINAGPLGSLGPAFIFDRALESSDIASFRSLGLFSDGQSLLPWPNPWQL